MSPELHMPDDMSFYLLKYSTIGQTKIYRGDI